MEYVCGFISGLSILFHCLQFMPGRVGFVVQSSSRVQLFATPQTVAHQAPLSSGFSRQKDWSGLPFSSPGDVPNPGIKPRSCPLQADSLPSEPPGKLKIEAK